FGSGCDWCVAVEHDLRSAQRAAVDPNLVDLALEPFWPDVVPTDAESARRHTDRRGEGTRRDERAVHIELPARSVVGGREMAPRIQGQRRGGSDGLSADPGRWPPRVG